MDDATMAGNDMRQELQELKTAINDLKKEMGTAFDASRDRDEKLAQGLNESKKRDEEVARGLNESKIRDEELRRLTKFGLEAREVLKESIEARFDAADKKHDEEIGLLKDVLRAVRR